MRFVVIAAVACGHPAPVPSEPPPRAASTPDAAPVEPPPSIAIELADTRAGAVIGLACADTPAAGELCRICDRYGRIAAVVVPGDFVGFGASDPDLIVARDPGGGGRRLTFALAIGHDALRAQVLTCPGCARQMGWGAVAALAALPDVGADDRIALQVALGYPASPLLDGDGFRVPPPQSPAARAPCPP